MFGKIKKINERFSFVSFNRAFSVIELLVVVAIISLISGIVLYNHRIFSGGVALENLAYEIALTIRQAQFFGVNVRVAQTTSGGTTFEAPYGVYFDINNPSQFIFFADLDADGYYDSPGELVEAYNITPGRQIKNLCIEDSCASPVDELNITFKRPDPDAVIKTDKVPDCGDGCSSAQIYVGTTDGSLPDKVVNIGVTGQISIEN